MTPKLTVAFVVSLTLFMTPKGHAVIRGSRDLLYDPKVTVTFVVGLTSFMTPIGQRVIRGRRNLLKDPEGYGLCGRLTLLWPKKVKGSLEVAVTYFMTPKVTVTFMVGLT